jgi:hypothetical protein
MEGVTLFSLQPGPTSPAWGSASGRDVPMPIVDLAGDLVDFSDTAAVLGEMDLVITVDTAVAHLAGALDRPTWLLLSHVADFRWLRDRTDTPWYPSMRLYRQSTRGDWAGVIARVAHDLSERTGSCAGHRPLESVHVDDSEADSSKGSLPEVPCPQ